MISSLNEVIYVWRDTAGHWWELIGAHMNYTKSIFTRGSILYKLEFHLWRGRAFGCSFRPWVQCSLALFIHIFCLFVKESSQKGFFTERLCPSPRSLTCLTCERYYQNAFHMSATSQSTHAVSVWTTPNVLVLHFYKIPTTTNLSWWLDEDLAQNRNTWVGMEKSVSKPIYFRVCLVW